MINCGGQALKISIMLHC